MQLADNEALCEEIKLTFFFLKKKKFNGSCRGKPLRATVTHLTNILHISLRSLILVHFCRHTS